MIYLDLFWGFLKVGCFAFGGAYGAIGLIRDIVMQYGWLTDEEVSYLIAVSESTPGPIMVNMATYVGSTQAGLAGAALATLGVVLPAFAIILILTIILKSALKNRYVKGFLDGITPCIIGIVLATGIWMVLKNCITADMVSVDAKALFLTIVLGGIMFLYTKLRKKKLSPISFIMISAVMGIIFYY